MRNTVFFKYLVLRWWRRCVTTDVCIQEHMVREEAKALTPKQCAVIELALDTIKVRLNTTNSSIQIVMFLLVKHWCCVFLTVFVIAILSCWWCGLEKDVFGEESRPAVSALRSLSLHTSHWQTYQEICSVPAHSGYNHTHTHNDFVLLLPYRMSVVILLRTFRRHDWDYESTYLHVCVWNHLCFLLSVVHGGKGVRYTNSEDVYPEKGLCLTSVIFMW